jgi:DNA-binding MarR family transcriptional regulator
MKQTPAKTVSDDALLLLRALRALIRSQQISERADTSCCGMTVAGAAVIQLLYLEGPLRLGALSKRLGIAPSTLTRNVERIEERGLVRGVPDPDDGRALRMRLTTSGRRAAREFERQNEHFAELLLQGLPATRRRRAVEGLMDLLEGIDKIAGPSCPAQFKPVREFLEAERAWAPAKEV